MRYDRNRREDVIHAPDGFLNTGTAVATAAISAGTLGVTLRQLRDVVAGRTIPLAGVTAAFVFAAQMFNFPVAAGTTGHLIGAALAAILLGPHLGAIVVAVVVMVQAVFFADGGLTALGYNILNMAIVPAYGGYTVFALMRRVFGSGKGSVIAATVVASWLSVVLSASAFAIEWLFGATAPVTFPQVFAAMVGVHMLIGVGEAVISSVAVGAVVSTRPDIVHGVSEVDRHMPEAGGRVTTRAVLVCGLLAALFLAAIVSQFALGDPDGLESVAETEGFIDSASQHAFADWAFADYATRGVANEAVSLAVAGIFGVLITLLVTWGIVLAVRDKPIRPTST
ncbi:MAG: energy-coupling factor ABC transporter permease [Actinobacteria bacterium]|nr:energy-coupling factor ABC transporter permease [Actinomycetota bacterium]